MPTNGAWTRFLLHNGFGLLGSLKSVGDKLTAIMTYHIIPSPLTPDDLSGPAGTVPTVFGLLAGGGDGSLKRWIQDGQFLFQGQLGTETIAGVGSYKQVCNSWIYIVDEVLLPADKFSEVPVVQIPDLSAIFGGGSSGPSPSPTPDASGASPAPVLPAVPSAPAPEGTTPVPAPAAVRRRPCTGCTLRACSSAAPHPTNSRRASRSPPAPPSSVCVLQQPVCGTTFSSAIGSTSGLSILKTVLAQPSFANLLPDPSLPYTLFAPVDSAFYGLLSTFSERARRARGGRGAGRGPGAALSAAAAPATPPAP